MANRTYNQFAGTLERKVVKLFAKILWTDPGSGVVPTLVTSEVLNSGTSPVTINPSQGFESLTDNTGGEFVLTLGANNGGVPTYDPYVRLLNVSGAAIYPSAPGASVQDQLITVGVVTNNVNGSAGNPSLTLVTLGADSSGNPVNAVLVDNTVLLLEITLSNTTAY